MGDSAIILAGGFGTRLQSVIKDVPKPMASIKNYPFLHYQLKYLSSQSIRRVVIAVGYKYESITGYFKDRYLDIDIEYVIEDFPLGTGGAFLSAANKLNSKKPYYVLNGDTFFPINLSRLNEYSLRIGSDITIAVFKSNDTARYMCLELNNAGKIISLSSRDPTGFINGGIYWMNSEVVTKINIFFNANHKHSLESDILPKIESIYGLEFSDTFIDIGIPEDYERSKLIIR